MVGGGAGGGGGAWSGTAEGRVRKKSIIEVCRMGVERAIEAGAGTGVGGKRLEVVGSRGKN